MSTASDTTIAILTLADVKSFIEGSTTGGTSGVNDKYCDVINDVSGMFNAFTQRFLLKTDYTSDYDGNGQDTMFLEHYPVSTSGISVTIDSARLFTTDLAVSTSEVMVYHDRGRLSLVDDIFRSGYKNIRVGYSAGYSLSGMPYDLRRAAKEMALFIFNRETNKDRIGIRNEAAEGMSRTFENQMPESVKQILNLYRDTQIG